MEHLLETNLWNGLKTFQVLSILARYYCHICGYHYEELIRELHTFMEQHYKRYNPVDWTASIEACANRAPKYPLCQCDGVWITKNELDVIENLQDKVLERLAFTLLCLAKFRNFKNKENQNWVTNSDSEIYKLACITTTAFEKDIRFHKLKELGLIDFAKKIDNLSIQVRFVDDETKGTLFINDFRKLGYEWRSYKGESYIRCAQCKILVRKTSLNKKYCKDCAKQNPYYSPVGMKTITCVDCKETFEAEAASRECRCKACKFLHKKEIQRIKMRRYRNKTTA